MKPSWTRTGRAVMRAHLRDTTIDLPPRASFWREWGAFIGITVIAAVFMAVVALGTG